MLNAPRVDAVMDAAGRGALPAAIELVESGETHDKIVLRAARSPESAYRTSALGANRRLGASAEAADHVSGQRVRARRWP